MRRLRLETLRAAGLTALIALSNAAPASADVPSTRAKPGEAGLQGPFLGAVPAQPLDPDVLRRLAEQSAAMFTALRRDWAEAEEAEPSWEQFKDAKLAGGPQWECLTEALYFEARGEKLAGQVAVAEVILNRVDSGSFPGTVCGVVSQGVSRGKHACQFSYKCDGRPETISEKGAYRRVARVARRMIDGMPRDLTDGATHYHARQVRPRWARRLEHTAEIGAHHFYRKPNEVARNMDEPPARPEQY